MSENRKFYARLCWNSREWTEPTGEAAQLESALSYTSQNGFGHEEWLFRYRLVAGFQYGFIQSLQKSRRCKPGDKIDLILWSINPDRRRVIIGTMVNCEILDEYASQAALDIYRKSRWLASMVEEVNKLPRSSGKQSSKLADLSFNIRFKKADVKLNEKPYPYAESKSIITAVKHYQLNEFSDSEIIRKATATPRRRGTTTLPSTGPVTRSASVATIVNRPHAEIQKALQELLESRLGRGVIREANYIDLLVQYKSEQLLFEIKSSPVAKSAIREALGQILEYAFFDQKPDKERTKLFIVAPGERDEKIDEYIRFLRETLNMPIEYCSFAVGNELPLPIAASIQSLK